MITILFGKDGKKMKNKIADFIHVGDYKTGTSWLQQTVFPFHPEIQYLGDHFHKSELNQALRELVDIRDLDFDADKIKSVFVQNIESNVAGNPAKVIKYRI